MPSDGGLVDWRFGTVLSCDSRQRVSVDFASNAIPAGVLQPEVGHVADLYDGQHVIYTNFLDPSERHEGRLLEVFASGIAAVLFDDDSHASVHLVRSYEVRKDSGGTGWSIGERVVRVVGPQPALQWYTGTVTSVAPARLCVAFDVRPETCIDPDAAGLAPALDGIGAIRVRSRVEYHDAFGSAAPAAAIVRETFADGLVSVEFAGDTIAHLVRFFELTTR